MLCEKVSPLKNVEDITIVMHGNTFNRFYRYPNPKYVEPREYKVTHTKSDADELLQT